MYGHAQVQRTAKEWFRGASPPKKKAWSSDSVCACLCKSLGDLAMDPGFSKNSLARSRTSSKDKKNSKKEWAGASSDPIVFDPNARR
jgi:hypothetical protein